ncbi:MAG: single-stranded DNA-binding protein [Hyphomicrobiales bacterium]|nr:MAG: single-stranded DNA-binding protein [Hyphomicrobiales bacterium]
MSAFVLVSGVLFKAPERRTSKAGKPFVTATIKCREGDAATFWRLTVFSESCQEELLLLTEGDARAAQGSMKAELFQPEGGAARVSLSMIADQVLPARAIRKRKDDDRQPEPESKASPARPADWRAREGRRRSLSEQAANGGSAVGYGRAPRAWAGDGRAEPALNDDPF